jgi:hypothetical protein
MRNEDLVPTFAYKLQQLARQPGILLAKIRRQHAKLVREIEARIENEIEFEDSDLGIGGYADDDLESIFDALEEYAAPYFYFGTHPGDGSDYGFWLREDWDADFRAIDHKPDAGQTLTRDEMTCPIKVSDLADVPTWFRGEVAVVNDHGNVTLYFKTSRSLREVWAIV